MNRLEEAVQDALASASATPDVQELRVLVRRHRERRRAVTIVLGTIVILIGLGVAMSATRHHAAPLIRTPPANVPDSALTPVTRDRSFTGDDGRVVRAVEFDFDARIPMPTVGRYHWDSPVLKSPVFRDPTNEPAFSLGYGFESGTAIIGRGWKQSIAFRAGGWVVSIDATVESVVGKPTMLIHGIELEQSQLGPAPAP